MHFEQNVRRYQNQIGSICASDLTRLSNEEDLFLERDLLESTEAYYWRKEIKGGLDYSIYLHARILNARF